MPLHTEAEAVVTRFDGLDYAVVSAGANPHSATGFGDGLMVEAVYGVGRVAKNLRKVASRFEFQGVSRFTVTELMGPGSRKVDREVVVQRAPVV